MPDHVAEPNEFRGIKKHELTPELRELFKSINVTRSQCSLYGPEHPSTQAMVQEVVRKIAQFVDGFGPSTFVFAKDALIISDTYYVASRESRAIFQRLYARAVMAVTFTGPPPASQFTQLLTLLNTDPAEIRAEEGPSAYLRRRGVTKIAVTEAMYESGEEDAGESDDDTPVAMPTVDAAIAAVINWLAKNDDDPELPRVPIAEILSQPDLAARLIQEAVTKLHAAGRTESPAELAMQAIEEMKDLSAQEPGCWDKAAPRIREAISKLPRELRPGVLGFGSDAPVANDGSLTGRKPGTIDIAEFETIVNDLLAEDSQLFGTPDGLPPLRNLDGLFSAMCAGLLPSWQVELTPASLAEASGRSYAVLMAWEANATEHGHMTRRLADLARTEYEAGNADAALGLAGSLAEEACRSDALPGRTTNALNALEGLGVPLLRSLVEHALKSANPREHKTAAVLVESLPELALSAVDLLESYMSRSFADSMKEGIVKAGREALPALRRLVETGSHATRELAIETLVEFRTDWAATEIESCLSHAAPDVIEAALPRMRVFPAPLAIRACVSQLRHRRPEVRCAALRTLGYLQDDSVIPYLTRFAFGRAFALRGREDQVEAIRALGVVGTDEAYTVLEHVSRRRWFCLPATQRSLHAAAIEAMQQIRSGKTAAPSKIAA